MSIGVSVARQIGCVPAPWALRSHYGVRRNDYVTIPLHKRPPCPVCGTPNALTAHDAKSCRACWKARIRREPVPTPVPEDGPPLSTLFDERWETFTKWIGRSRPSKSGPPKVAGLPREITAHSGDWHIPHMNWDAFGAWVDANRDANRAVVGGDGINAGAASRFIETDFVTPRDEFQQLTQALQICAETWPEVYVNIGNHVDRFRKYFGARLPPYMMFLVQTNPIQFVIEGLRREHGVNNLHLAKPMIDGLESSNFGTFIGDCAFVHGEAHSKIKMRPAESVARWMRRWEQHLPCRPRVIVQEHNHVGGGPNWDAELQAWLIQAPCLSQNVNYQTDARLSYGPNQWGWTRIVQEHGKTLMNESRWHLYEGT